MRYLWPSGGSIPTLGYVLAAQNMRGIPSSIVAGSIWAADIGCLNGPEFVKRCDIEKALAWLFDTMARYRQLCLFVTVPDFVGDAQKTFDVFHSFQCRFLGWPIAYIAQDGSESLPIPTGCSTVFIGGSTVWKMSVEAEYVIQQALTLGKHVHIGRVNSWKRYAHFRIMPQSESFTCDGTRIRYERDKAIREWCAYQQQPPLFAHASAHASNHARNN